MPKLEFPGSITLDRGKYRARVMVGGQRIPVGTLDTWEDAAGAIAEFWRLRAAEEVAVGSGIMSLREWGGRYLDDRETDGWHRSVARDRARWHARIAEKAIGAMSLDTITARDVRAWVSDQVREPSARGKPPAKQTVLNALNLLRVALESAVEKGHIPSNPARDVRVPRMAQTEEVWDWLRADEVDRLIGHASLTAEQRRLFTVAVYTGLRKGELWGLRWKDVDLARAELVVVKSYAGATKGGRGRRVPLLKPALDALKALSALPRLCSLVFPGHGPVMRNAYDSLGLEEACAAAKVRRIRFHDLRHSAASHLVQGTWAPALIAGPLRLEEVKEWLGHKSISTTQRYAHFCADSIHGKVLRELPKPQPAPGPKAVAAAWPQVAAGAAGRAMQMIGIIEASTGFEPVYDGFANRAEAPKVPHGLADPRACRDRILELLAIYARGETPLDVAVVDLLAEAAFELGLLARTQVEKAG
jgi:integrase